jgi:CelD/BcsL family acetyltransferase involved in cellulose biosynthesis
MPRWSRCATAPGVDDAVRSTVEGGSDRVAAASVGDIAGVWDALADAVAAPPWARPGWIDVWSRSFGCSCRAIELRRAGRLCAVAPVIHGRLGGAVAAANVHTPEYVILAADPDAEAALVRGIVQRAGSLRIPRIDRAVAERLGRVLVGSGARASVRALGESPAIDLASTWAEYRRTISSRARSIERELRRLGRRQGPVDVVDIRGGPDLDRYIDIGFDLEGSGWKARDGTAIVSRRDTAAFYRELCHWAAARGVLRLSFLRAGRQAIAFDLSLESGGVVSTLKGGYDPRYRSYGPGVMLTYETIRRLFDERMARYELLGESETFKQSFTTAGRGQATLYAARGDARGLVSGAAHDVRVRLRAEMKPVGAPLVSKYRRLRFGAAETRDASHDIER